MQAIDNTHEPIPGRIYYRPRSLAEIDAAELDARLGAACRALGACGLSHLAPTLREAPAANVARILAIVRALRVASEHEPAVLAYATVARNALGALMAVLP